MLDDEDYEFTIETSTGTRDIGISKTLLTRIAGGDRAAAKVIVQERHDDILEIVERKISKGRLGLGQIRIHGTDR